MLVELVNIQTSATLVHWHVSGHWTFDLYRLGTVTLLGVELTFVHGLDVHNVTLGMNAATSAVWS